MKKATTTVTSSAAKPAKKAPAKRAPASTVSKPKKANDTAPAATSASSRQTEVTARVDVGFGNLLFIRGEGPGLSWDQGVPMECASSDLWLWTTGSATRPFAYKVLINDENWSAGDDYVASVGVENAIVPVF